ncbi:MAG TPA: hypothetical protein VGU20_25520 [Stellaceae bacterium]|nr:hypothetical protein [Stellaceae bacterium]
MSISHLRLGAVAVALVFASTLLSTAPVLADPPPWAPAHGHRDKHHGRDDDDAPRVIVTQPPPAVVVAPAPAPIYVAPPPAVVYQPAPVVAPPSSIDIVVPLHFH